MTGDAALVAFTLRTAALATLVVVLPGTLVAWCLAGRWRGRAVLEALVTLPLVLPPTAIGLALLVTLSRGPFDVVFTQGAVVIATAVMSFPLFVRSARAALEDVDPRLVAVARTLGRRPVGAFFSVQLPLAWRGLVAGAVLAFCRALGEFGATIVVAGNIPGRTQTLALALFSDVQAGREAHALQLAGLAAVLALAALLVVEALSRRREKALGDAS